MERGNEIQHWPSRYIPKEGVDYQHTSDSLRRYKPESSVQLFRRLGLTALGAAHTQVPYYCPACDTDTYHSLDGCEICEDTDHDDGTLH